MKKTAIAMMAACMLTAAAPLMAADMGSQGGKQGSRDECLLYSKKCADQVDSLQDRIKKLHQEINKGTRTYSVEELKRLDMKLKEANDTLDRLQRY